MLGIKMIKKTMYFYDEKQANLIKKVNDKLHRQRGVKVGDAPDTKIIVNILHKAAQEAAQQYNDNKGMGFASIYKMLANKLIEFKNIVERMGTQYLKEEQLINAISSIKDTSAPKEFNMLKRDTINQLKKAFK